MWNDLTMAQKADIIQMSVKSGIRDINQIKNTYNSSLMDQSAQVPTQEESHVAKDIQQQEEQEGTPVWQDIINDLRESDNAEDASNTNPTDPHDNIKMYKNGGPLKEFFRRMFDETARNAPVYNTGTFNDAYADARKNHKHTFYYKGNYYNTNDKYNPKAWDYSEKKSFGEAYQAAKASENKEFNYKGHTYAAGDPTARDLYTMHTGLDWKTAKKYGFTDGSAERNLQMLDFMKNDEGLQAISANRDITPNEFAGLYSNYLGYNYLKQREDKTSRNWDMSKGVITLSESGKNTGTVIPVDMMDYIMETAEKTNTPLNIAFGLPAQESAFSGYGEGWSDLRFLLSDWNYTTSEALTHHERALNKAKNGEEPDYLTGFNYMMKKYNERLKSIDEPILEHAYRIYKEGLYNPGDPRHSSMVESRGNDFLKAKEVQEYLENYYANKQK